MQHFAFSWQMHGGEFAKVEDVANSSVTFNKSLNGWLSGLSEQRLRRDACVDVVLGIGGLGAITSPVWWRPDEGDSPICSEHMYRTQRRDRRNINQALIMILLQAALSRNPKVQRK